MTAAKSPQGVDIGAKLLGEFVNDVYTLRIEAHNNQLECRADITVHNTNDSISPSDLISILRNQNITETVDLEQVAIFCSEAALGEDPQQFVLARGTAPVHGKDGWFELIVATGKEKTDLVEDKSGRVDFKSVQTFSNVVPEQHIGNIHLPTAGEPGNTITNEILPPLAGKPSHIIAGSGVRFSDDGTQAIAEQAGRVVFDNNVLTVAEEFTVNGDVDLSVGHISFKGFVDIKGDVLDDFNISATKGINITGAAGACQINSDGPVTIGTMAGKGTGRIICKGTLQARYLNQVTVECQGNVNISHEVRNAVIKSTSSINIPKGLVTGGELVALEGVEVKILGAMAGAKTSVTSGVYFPETDRLRFLRNQIKSLVGQIKRIGTTLHILNKRPGTEQRKALREATELRIGILTQRRVNLDEEREELAEELLNFSVDEHPTANPQINILSTLKEGVAIELGETSDIIKTEISGPVSIVENSEQGGFRYLTYSPLKVGTEQTEKGTRLEGKARKS
ncbi:MAG: FapA family protein [Desulfuromusa sp.]|nr:FapA family protein [Desulfuromusa sp.]